MREIKFRAWDGEKYTCPVSVNKDGTASYCISEGFAFQYDPQYKEYEIVEQYTGLKDKNGVEIYEGDIVFAHMNQKTYQVIHGLYQSYLIDEDDNFDYGWYIEENGDDDGMGENISSANRWLKVIGNIHE